MKLHQRFTLILLSVLLCFTGAALAQQNQGDAATEETSEAPVTIDPLGRDTPISSLRAFAAAADALDWNLAAEYLDLRNLPSGVRGIPGPVLAEQLYFVLQRREVNINTGGFSDKPEGDLFDDLPEYRDELGRIQFEEEEVPLLIQRVPGTEDNYVWKISNATVSRVPALYDGYSYPDWMERIRDALPEGYAFLGLELYKWVILLLALVVLWPVIWILAWLLARIISRPGAPLWKEVRGLLTGPITGLVLGFLLYQLMLELGLGATARRITNAHTLTTLFSIWFVWRSVDLWRARRRLNYERQGRTDAAVLGRPLANAVKLITLLLGLLVWLANAGVDISALLTGLGIGGIAIALALQKPIEDLFGAVSIYSQRPVNTGDLCRYGDSLGRVEEIGLRTTQIRTLSNTVVHVPNSTLSTGIIENLTARTKIMYEPDLPLRYDTSRTQLEAVLGDLESMLREQTIVEQETVRVNLREFTENAILVRVRVFALTREIGAYLAAVQDINLKIMEILDRHGVRFSQRSQTLFIKDGNAGALRPSETSGPA